MLGYGDHSSKIESSKHELAHEIAFLHPNAKVELQEGKETLQLCSLHPRNDIYIYKEGDLVYNETEPPLISQPAMNFRMRWSWSRSQSLSVNQPIDSYTTHRINLV